MLDAAGQQRPGPARRDAEGARGREAALGARARRPSISSTSRSSPCAASSPRWRRRSTPPRPRTRNPGPHRRARLAPQRRAGPARAGAGALSLRLLRPPAPDPRHAARHPRRRRPLRLPVRGVLRCRPGRAEARGPGELDKLATVAARSRQRDAAGHPLDPARRRPHRQPADPHRRNSPRTGISRRRAPSRWSST